MSKTKNKNSTCAVYKQYKTSGKWYIIGYLSARDEEKGLDIYYDTKGYKVVAL